MMQKLLNAHPAITFKTAYGYIKTIGSTKGDFLDRTSLLRAMGFKTATGNASNAIGSLVHFGLLIRVDGGYLITKSARELLGANYGSKDWRDKAQNIVIKPELYKKLFRMYRGMELPRSLANDLIEEYGDRNINKKNVDRIIKNYLESLRFAGYEVQQSEDAQREPLNKMRVLLGRHSVEISTKYMVEAYEKTLKDDLALVQKEVDI